MSEVERLQAYHPFSEETLETVAEVAEKHRSFETWSDYYADVLANPSREIKQTGANSPNHFMATDVLTIRAREEKDVLAYHLPMGNGIDPNMMTRLFVLADALPNTTIIATGNPGSPGNESGILPRRELRKVWSGDLRETVEPLLHHALLWGFDSMQHVGFSYGADRAATAAAHSERYDIEATSAILMEPTSIKRRSLLTMGTTFASTAGHLQEYVDAANSPAYQDARDLAEKQAHGMLGFVGLARATNLAITHALGRNLFKERLEEALDAQPNLRASIIWGTESELAINALVESTVRMLQHRSHQRVHGAAIEGAHHAMGDDIFLHTALVLHGQEQNASDK